MPRVRCPHGCVYDIECEGGITRCCGCDTVLADDRPTQPRVDQTPGPGKAAGDGGEVIDMTKNDDGGFTLVKK